MLSKSVIKVKLLYVFRHLLSEQTFVKLCNMHMKDALVHVVISLIND